MKQILITIALLILLFLIQSGFQLELKPFSIKLNAPFNSIGWMLIVIGIVFTNVSSYRSGRKEGIKIHTEWVQEEINQIKIRS